MRQFTLMCLLVTLFAAPRALAQGCGLPDSGTVTVSTTYTLTADCTMTDTLEFGEVDVNANKITITINGDGHTITGTSNLCGANPPGKITIRTHPNVEFNLNNVTIKGGGRQSQGAISLDNSAHSATFSNVTFHQTNCSALWLDNTAGSAITHSLSNLLIVGARGQLISATFGHPAGIQTVGPVSLNINNIALRAITSGNAAIGANDTYSPNFPATKGRITFSGCLTVDGVFPRVYYGDIADNSTGPCSGTIGNGGSTAMANPQAPTSDCGLPLAGFIYGKHTFNLRGDCVMSNALFIPYESDVVINGNGHTLQNLRMRVAGKFRLSNAVASGATNYFPINTNLDRRMTISNVIFRDNPLPLVFQDSIVTLDNVLIENHSQTRSAWPSAVFVNLSAQVTIRDSVFRGNTGGVAVLHAGWGEPVYPTVRGPAPATTLEGCITFENNSPSDIYDTHSLLTDKRTGPCPPDMIFLLGSGGPSASNPGSHGLALPPIMGCERQGEVEALPLGAIACIFRYSKAGETVMHVYEIEPVSSRSNHKLTLRQSQLSALAGEPFAAVSTDGRALAVVWPDDNVTIKVGPDHESKILHLTLAGGLGGGVIGLTTTYGEAPGLPYISPQGQAVQPVAGPAAPLDCMVTTQYILNLRDVPAGNIKYFLPYNVTLTVTARAEGWYEVDYHGERGWLSADYVTPAADCG